jgi:hypothetical protein
MAVPKPPLRIVLIVGVVILVVLIAYIVTQRKAGAPETTEPIATQPAEGEDVPSPDMAAQAAAGEEAAVAAPEGEPAAEALPAEDTELAADEDETALARDMVALEQQIRERLAAQLDKRFPVFKRDQDVSLRGNNGIVHRGTYIGVTKGNAILMVDDGPAEVPLKSLDRQTRIRCDKVYRDRYIEYRVRKRMERFEKL